MHGTLRRRLLLQAAAVWTATGKLWPRTALAGPAPEDDTFASYIDTLIPEDEGSPGAAALGVDRSLLDEVSGDPSAAAFFADACRWLDERARDRGADRFAALAEAERIAVVAGMEAADPETGPHRFFLFTRARAVEHYYSRPETWASLGLEGPPQWAGYPDYDKPPGPLP